MRARRTGRRFEDCSVDVGRQLAFLEHPLRRILEGGLHIVVGDPRRAATLAVKRSASSADAALASEASGQRGDFNVRAHRSKMRVNALMTLLNRLVGAGGAAAGLGRISGVAPIGASRRQ